MKNTFLFILSILLSLSLWAQDRNDAVVYIQSDKETPIYVKMEGQMMERFSKHYVVMHGLASGPLHLEILFQQNQYPPQTFVLNVPPSSQRSLVLKKVDSKKFALYDLNYGIYLQEGNSVSDDIDISSPRFTANESASTTAVVAKKDDAIPAFKADQTEAVASQNSKRKNREERKAKEEKEQLAAVKTKTEKETPAEKPKKSDRKKNEIEKESVVKEPESRFLDFEIDKADKQSEESSVKINRKTGAKTKCTEAASESQFNALASLITAFDDEEKKLATVRKNGLKYCFSTDQVRLIAMNFESQSSRYEVARVLKNNVIDKDNYQSLSVLFNTNYLKERFKNEIVGK